MGDRILADVLSVCKAESVNEFWAHVDQQKQYIRNFYSEVGQVPLVNIIEMLLTTKRIGMG